MIFGLLTQVKKGSNSMSGYFMFFSYCRQAPTGHTFRFDCSSQVLEKFPNKRVRRHSGACEVSPNDCLRFLSIDSVSDDWMNKTNSRPNPGFLHPVTG
jgi:hypothetical protein